MKKFPHIGEHSIPDAEEDLECMGIPVFRKVFEAKSHLSSPSELESLKRQIAKYIATGRFIGGQILIWQDAREDLYDELIAFCSRFGLERFLPYGIRVELFDSHVENDEDIV